MILIEFRNNECCCSHVSQEDHEMDKSCHDGLFRREQPFSASLEEKFFNDFKCAQIPFHYVRELEIRIGLK
jgi:hypothetical protein